MIEAREVKFIQLLVRLRRQVGFEENHQSGVRVSKKDGTLPAASRASLAVHALNEGLRCVIGVLGEAF